jgi:hypothetical protein
MYSGVQLPRPFRAEQLLLRPFRDKAANVIRPAVDLLL